MGIREKFVLAVMIGVAAFIALFTLSLLEQRKVVLAAYEARNASVVDLTVSMLQQIDARRLEGQMDLKAAQDQAKATLRALRYDNGDYIFVLGLDGGFIVNPGFPHLEGTVPRDLVDVEGRPLLSRLADVAAQGVGTVRYRYPRVHGGESVEKHRRCACSRRGAGLSVPAPMWTTSRPCSPSGPGNSPWWWCPWGWC